MKTVMTIAAIRPDLIRLCATIKKLDQTEGIRHVFVHTGQHYDDNLSEVFYRDLELRKPNYQLAAGRDATDHFDQLSRAWPELKRICNLEKPDLIIFLGDSNSVLLAIPLKKEGYKIAHIEAGMRSGDYRMLEEINRKAVDSICDHLFAYHNTYKMNLVKEGVSEARITVVGNTCVEPMEDFIKTQEGTEDYPTLDSVILDIHRKENTDCPIRMKNILDFTIASIKNMDIEKVKMIDFHSTRNLDLSKYPEIERVPLMSYRKYLVACYHAKFVISDSGTACEELVQMPVKVIVPRDFTERPLAYKTGCVTPIDVNTSENDSWTKALDFLQDFSPIDRGWLFPPGFYFTRKTTSDLIVEKIGKLLKV